VLGGSLNTLNPSYYSRARAELLVLAERRAARRFECLYWESQRRCTSLLASSNDAIAYTADGMHVFANRMYLELFGFGHDDEVQGLPLLDLVAAGHEGDFRDFMRGLGHSNEEQATEVLCSRNAGKPFRALMDFSRATFDGEACHQVVVQDLSERDALEAQLDRLRSRDRLTGLFNHLHFLNLLTKHINRPNLSETCSLGWSS
jgi:PAS domain S-box-containing protein